MGTKTVCSNCGGDYDEYEDGSCPKCYPEANYEKYALDRLKYVRCSFVIRDDDYTRGYLAACDRLKEYLTK